MHQSECRAASSKVTNDDNQRINSVVPVKVLSEAMKIILGVGPSKEKGPRSRQRKKSLTSEGIEPMTYGLDHPMLYRPS